MTARVLKSLCLKWGCFNSNLHPAFMSLDHCCFAKWHHIGSCPIAWLGRFEFVKPKYTYTISFISILRPENSIFYISVSDNSVSESTGKKSLYGSFLNWWILNIQKGREKQILCSSLSSSTVASGVLQAVPVWLTSRQWSAPVKCRRLPSAVLMFCSSSNFGWFSSWCKGWPLVVYWL